MSAYYVVGIYKKWLKFISQNPRHVEKSTQEALGNLPHFSRCNASSACLPPTRWPVTTICPPEAGDPRQPRPPTTDGTWEDLPRNIPHLTTTANRSQSSFLL